MIQDTTKRPAIGIISAVVTTIVVMNGCTAGSSWLDDAGGRTVALGEFASDDAQAVREVNLPVEPGESGDVESAAEVTDDVADASGDAPPVTIEQTPAAEPPTPVTVHQIKPGDKVVVDSLIGQVNGRPIFADEFFQPIEAQLIAASNRLDANEFNREAMRIVTSHLEEVVLNELFLAEAESGLSQEERKGIFGFMRYIQERMISQSGGIEKEARERLALEDMTLEQYLELEKNRALIQKLIIEKIRPRVIVSWRDIEREYERRVEEFNPPAQVTLARIRLSTDAQAEQIKQVKTRLAEGEPFTQIATDLGLADGGTWRTIQMGGAGEQDVALSSEFIDRLGEIKVGATTEPFEVGSSTWWLYVAEVERPPARSIYDPDVQRMLSQHLHSVRFSEEFAHYRSKLFQRGIFDELNEMRQRLLAVATLRYGP